MLHKGKRLCIVILVLDKQIYGLGRILIFLAFFTKEKLKSYVEIMSVRPFSVHP